VSAALCGAFYGASKVIEDSGTKSNYGPTPLNHRYATPRLKSRCSKAMSAVTNKMRKTLGFKEEEDTSANEDVLHPYYHGDYGVGDDERETHMTLSPNTHTLPGSTSGPASINPLNRNKTGRRSYVPE
jgi:hypothetical protein